MAASTGAGQGIDEGPVRRPAAERAQVAPDAATRHRGPARTGFTGSADSLAVGLLVRP
jgi:hypothetical protein